MYRGSRVQRSVLRCFPIKVNQMREVVEEIMDAGEPYNYGLRRSSKPELMAVMAYNDNPEALTVLNGYKDKDYCDIGAAWTSTQA